MQIISMLFSVLMIQQVASLKPVSGGGMWSDSPVNSVEIKQTSSFVISEQYPGLPVTFKVVAAREQVNSKLFVCSIGSLTIYSIFQIRLLKE